MPRSEMSARISKMQDKIGRELVLRDVVPRILTLVHQVYTIYS